MGTGQILTNEGRKLILNRAWKDSPDYTVPSLFCVGTGTNTPVVGDTDLQTPVDITAGVQTKAFLSGYPIIDETTLQVTTRSVLLTTEANGNNITEFGIKNSDASKILFSRSVFTLINKTSSIQVIFVQKDLVE